MILIEETAAVSVAAREVDRVYGSSSNPLHLRLNNPLQLQLHVVERPVAKGRLVDGEVVLITVAHASTQTERTTSTADF